MSNTLDPSTPLFSGNAAYIEMLYEKWLSNTGSVDASWQALFAKPVAMRVRSRVRAGHTMFRI